MTRPTRLPIHATDATWTSGPASGENTKIEPSAAQKAQGHVAGATFKTEHANDLLNLINTWVAHLDVTDALFGDGIDGDVTISSNTTLTADMFYNNLTIDTSSILSPDGFRIFVKETLTIESGSSIDASGGDGGDGTTGPAVGGVGGTGSYTTPVGPLGISYDGGDGAAGAVDGGDGDGDNTRIGRGREGGDGGPASAQVGGAAGELFSDDLRLRPSVATLVIANIQTRADGISTFVGGTGGGGGAGESGSDAGGGGGGGAGIVLISAASIDHEGVISADGGDGGAGVLTGAGGGGGGAGRVILIYHDKIGAGTLTNAAGIGDTGGGGGAGGGVDGATAAAPVEIVIG